MLCRPAGLALAHHKRNARDISLGGMRVFTDDDLPVGSRLDLDVLLPDGCAVRCWARVVWLKALAPQNGAKYDVGLKFLDMAESDIQRLAAVLVPAY